VGIGISHRIKSGDFYKNRDRNISSLKTMMKDVEKTIIIESIAKFVSRKAAEKLGIDHSTLKRKKMKYPSCANSILKKPA